MSATTTTFPSATFAGSVPKIPFRNVLADDGYARLAMETEKDSGAWVPIEALTQVRLDLDIGAVGFPLPEFNTPLALEQTAALMLLYAVAVTPSNNDYRKGARPAWFYAAASMQGEPTFSMDHEALTSLVALARANKDAYPLAAEHVKAPSDIAAPFTFNYRAARLLYDGKLFNRLPACGVVEETNDQMWVGEVGRTLWVNIYHDGNDRGFHPDVIAAFAKSFIQNERVCQYIHLGCVLADCNAWKAHHYSDAPAEQTLDISPALEALSYFGVVPMS